MPTKYIIVITLFALALSGCRIEEPKPPESANLPNITMAESLPIFITEPSELEIADSYIETDPAFAVGALIDLKETKIYSLNSFLKEGERIEYKTKADSVFNFWVDKESSSKASWLNFVSMHLSDHVKAHVSVVKVGKASVLMKAINMSKVEEFSRDLSGNDQFNFGMITGYTDYLISASLFKDVGAGGDVSGYGAKINGKWHSKFGNEISYHKVIASWTPLMFLTSAAALQHGKQLPQTPLGVLTKEAIKRGDIYVIKLDSARVVEPHI